MVILSSWICVVCMIKIETVIFRACASSHDTFCSFCGIVIWTDLKTASRIVYDAMIYELEETIVSYLNIYLELASEACCACLYQL